MPGIIWPMRSIAQRITDLLIWWRIPLAVLGIVAMVLGFLPSEGLQFDRSVENMFAPDDPLMVPYDKLTRTFGGNQIVMAVYADEQLLAADGSGIRRLAELSDRLEAVPGVRGVVSLDMPLGPAVARRDFPLARRIRELFQGYTHNAAGDVAAVVCLLAPQSETKVPRRKTVKELRRIIGELPSGMATGQPVMVADSLRYIESDGQRLRWVSTVLLAVTILVCFRSVRWVIVPIAVVQLTLTLTNVTLAWYGLRLSMVSSMLSAIVTVVGIATVIHIIVRFREARLGGFSPREALSRAGGLLAVPIFWACATDAVGFASLRMAKVGPVQDFGLMMAIGSLLVIVGTAMLVPGLALFGRVDADPKRAWGEGRLDVGLDRLAGWVRRRQKTVASATLVLIAVAAGGASRLQVETDFTKNFRSDSPIVRSYRFVEERLGGAGIWDVIVPAPRMLEWEYLRRVRRMEDRLRDEVLVEDAEGKSTPALTKVISLADIVVSAAGDPDRVSSKVLRGWMVSRGLSVTAYKMPAVMRVLHGEDPQQPGRYYLRIMLRAQERQPSAQKRRIIQQVEQIGREEFPPTDDSPGAEVTGSFVLLTSLIDSVIRDQWITFGVATAGIGLMMTVALRSPLLAMAALLPNALPIMVVTGLMGWIGLKINMGAAMIAAVSMGLSVDSSIHYISAFRRARAEGKSLDEALAAVHLSVGRAMVFSTLALIVGFTVLCTSHFVPTIYFGTLVSLSMLGGLAGNLVVLPLLLGLVTREKRPS